MSCLSTKAKDLDLELRFKDLRCLEQRGKRRGESWLLMLKDREPAPQPSTEKWTVRKILWRTVACHVRRIPLFRMVLCYDVTCDNKTLWLDFHLTWKLSLGNVCHNQCYYRFLSFSLATILDIFMWLCGVCVVGGWFTQPHLARVRLISLGLGGVPHL